MPSTTKPRHKDGATSSNGKPSATPMDRLRAAGAVRIGSPIAKALWMALWLMADANGVCFPSQAYLAERVEIDVRTVRRYLDAFEAAGLPRRKRRHRRNGARKSDSYTLLLPVPGALSGR